MKRDGPRFSRHAAARSQSRAIPHEVIGLVLDHANIERNVGGGVVSAMVTRRKLAELKAVPRNLREKMEGVVVLYAYGDGSIVSVMHAQGARARRYLHA
jgi:hypothetical protein